MLDHGMGRHNRGVSINTVSGHGKGRDGAHGIANRKAGHALADGRDLAGRLVTKLDRQAGRFEVSPGTEHCLGPTKADRPDPKPNLSGLQQTDIQFVDLKDFGASNTVEANDSGHGWLLLKICEFQIGGVERQADVQGRRRFSPKRTPFSLFARACRL
jgi:hypothetical protein